MGLRGLEKFCGLLDMPRPTHKNAYNKIQKNISEVAVQNAEKAMKEAADRAILFALENNPDGNTEVSPTGNIIGHIAVSVDGTWQKRGHCSKTGVVFVMSVDTGEVIDYELKQYFVESVPLINMIIKLLRDIRNGKKATKLYVTLTMTVLLKKWKK